MQLRGPNLFREYWRQPDATREAFASGWFDTGDLGSRDAAGFLTLVGRKNDLIITNGFNVYPQVVERVINECPGVRESAVLGVPDKRRGERVVAAVVRGDETLTERALRDLPAPSGWSTTSGRPTSSSSRPCRAMPWARSCGASCVINSIDRDDDIAVDRHRPIAVRGDVSMIDLAWISLAALVRGDRAELHDRGQSGVPLAGAGLGDRDLRRAGLGADGSRSARSWRVSHRPVPDAGRE